jgi:hypothetical protein
MVHALKKAASFTKPGGVLIDIHDLLDPPRIEIHTSARKLYVGQLFSSNDFENQRQADQALNSAVQNGFLISEKARIFEYLILAESFEALNEWLADTWENAYMTDETRHLINQVINQEGKKIKIALRFASRILMLKPSRDSYN